MTTRRRLLGVVAAALLLRPDAGLGKPKRRRPPPPPPPPPPPARRIDVRVVEGGQLVELHVDQAGAHLGSTASRVPMTVSLDPDARRRLEAAARLAVAAETRRSCPENEIFITVAVDDTSNFMALCPTTPAAWVAPWRALLAVVAEITAQARGAAPKR